MTEMVKKKGGRHTTLQLARMAECGEPDAHDGVGFLSNEAMREREVDPSAGARFLRSVEDAVFEAVEEYGEGEPVDWSTIDPRREFEDRVHEIADAAPDVYTHTRWQEFVDLAAWEEDVTEYDPDAGELKLTNLAGVALYMIAERLAWALLEELAEDEETDGA